MNKIFLSAMTGLAVVSSFTAHAEPPAPPPVQSQSAPSEPAKGERGGRGAEMLEKLKKDVGLNDDQLKKVQSIMMEQRQAMKAVKNDAALTEDQKKDKLKAARGEIDAKISAILTPEQKAKWDQIKKDRPGRGGQ